MDERRQTTLVEIPKLIGDTLKTFKDFLRANFLLVFAGVILFGFIYIFFWEIPRRNLLGNIDKLQTLKEYYELKNSIRTTFAQALGGTAILIGLFFTWRNLRISQEGQITDRFTSGALLFQANLSGASLKDARSLTQEQIASAITDATTKLPDYLKAPADSDAT